MKTKSKSPKKHVIPDAHLVKVTFPKFPKHEVKVYFEKEKLEFRAAFGFEEYRAPSVPQLKQKIEKAIKNGATPEPVWKPMIYLSIGVDKGRTLYKQALDFELEFNVEREFYCLGARRKLLTCKWESPAKVRNKNATDAHGYFSGKWVKDESGPSKIKTLDRPTYAASNSWGWGGPRVYVLTPYTEQLWKELATLRESMVKGGQQLLSCIAKGTLGALLDLTLDFPASQRSKSSIQPMTGKPRKLSPTTVASRHAKASSLKKKWEKEKGEKAAKDEAICVCIPKRRADQIGTNPHCKFPHAGKPSGSFRGEDKSGVIHAGVGKLDPSITQEFRKALNLKLLKGLLESDDFGMPGAFGTPNPASNNDIMHDLRDAFKEGGTIEVKLPGDGPQLPPDLCKVTCRGGAGPAVWFKADATGKPDLKGKELIAAVREVMKIPCPLEHVHGAARRVMKIPLRSLLPEYKESLEQALIDSGHDSKNASCPHNRRPESPCNCPPPKPNGQIPKRLPIPNGTLPAHATQGLGYPEGTIITVDRKQGNSKDRIGNVHVTPKGHVTENYSIRWLEGKLKEKEVAWPTRDGEALAPGHGAANLAGVEA